MEIHVAGVAGAVSRTATAPVDRMKLLLQVDSTARGLTVRESWNRMVAEGGVIGQIWVFHHSPDVAGLLYTDIS